MPKKSNSLGACKNNQLPPYSSFIYYIYPNSFVFHENSLFITFIKNVCQWDMKTNSTPIQDLKKFNPPPWSPNSTPPEIWMTSPPTIITNGLFLMFAWVHIDACTWQLHHEFEVGWIVQWIIKDCWLDQSRTWTNQAT